ncbi:MAG: acyl carrier protein [Planctomycetaceae bacterium]|nr:acyl carrier protein [Planctomycetaceae bacterium]
MLQLFIRVRSEGIETESRTDRGRNGRRDSRVNPQLCQDCINRQNRRSGGHCWIQRRGKNRLKETEGQQKAGCWRVCPSPRIGEVGRTIGFTRIRKPDISPLDAHLGAETRPDLFCRLWGHSLQCTLCNTLCNNIAVCEPPLVATAWSVFILEDHSVSIEQDVIDIVSDQLDVPKEEISKTSSFVDDLKADSLDIVELVMALEDKFDIKIPDEDYDKIKTVGDAISYIENAR